MKLSRRCALALLPSLAVSTLPAAANGVRRGRAIVLPRDHGAHLDTRIEWWYATGWLGLPEAPSHGFQVTFFRSLTGLAQGLPGRLAPRHILFAHAALTDLAARRHLHDQQLQRWNGETGNEASPRVAGAAVDDTRVWIGHWSLQRDDSGYRARVDSQAGGQPWSLDLQLQTRQPLLLQGDAGYSRKGPLEHQASLYYSQPQLGVSGSLGLGGQRIAASGRAWIDHEWSDQILPADAVGWDWAGFNLFDGSALTVFQLRRADGSALWAGGSQRSPGSAPSTFASDALRWQPDRRWRSTVTGAEYPLQWQLDTPAGRFTVRALLDAQELDSRGGTGTVYWEGLSELLDADQRRVGLGYLEMTGYAGRLRL